MAGFVFLSFLFVSCLLFSCEGKVFAPSAGSTLTIARNSAESRIVWSFDDTITRTTRRTWSFIPPGQSPVVLAIIDNKDPFERFSTLLEFEIEEPATLILKNVNQTYNGTYQFGLVPSIGVGSSEVVVFIGDPPDNVKLTVTRSGKSANITCSAEAQPPASFKIFLNETNLVSTEKTYIIPEVNISHAGNYSCIAKNVLGKKTSNSMLFLMEEITPPPTHSTTTSRKNEVGTTREDNETKTERRTTKASITYNRGTGECHNCGTKWYVVVGSMISGIIIGLFLAYILLCASRRWFTIKKPERHVKPGTTQVDSTYQELDLTRMNKEDNYQSLRVNAASNDAANGDDSNYAELSKTREVENNYQSLT